MVGRYNSTYGFVAQNNLEEKAEEFFGQNWEAEDDVNQIQGFVKFLGEKNLVVSLIPNLDEDDILISEDTSKVISYDDTRDLAIRVIDILFEKGLIEESEDHYPFELQDEIHDKANELLGLDMEDNFEVRIQ